MMAAPIVPAGAGHSPVELAILTNRLQSVVRRMMNTLARTARSGVINAARDFSCCIITADDELLVTAESLPIHVMSGADMMGRVMKEFHPDLRAGDAYLHNSPYHGNSHPADHTILVPVVDAGGVHRFTVLAKAHQADCGNSAPSTYMPTATDVYEEGALIFPAVTIQRDYQDQADIIRMCRQRIRVPDQWWGDYLALLGAARIGERELLQIGADIGWDRLAAHSAAWFDYSERQMIATLRRLPAGRLSAVSTMDPFPGFPDGIPVRAEIDVDPAQARVSVDLRDNLDCLPCGLNLSEAASRTAAMIGIFNSIGATVPPNAGSFRRVDVVLRENCCVGVPRHPASCSMATTNLADRVANAVQSAFAELGDGVGLAECGSVIPPGAAVISGRDPRRDGARFVNQIFFGITGGAGAPRADGWLHITHVGNAGMMLHDSVEIAEAHHPIRIHEHRIMADTEGAGRHRGAPSAYVEYGPVGCELTVMFGSDGNVNPARGVRGGTSGGASAQYRRSAAGDLVPVDPLAPLVLSPDETVVSVSCGGGGYGDPVERDPDAVAKDVREGWVSADRAREVYGVVLDPSGAPEPAATAGLRANRS